MASTRATLDFRRLRGLCVVVPRWFLAMSSSRAKYASRQKIKLNHSVSGGARGSRTPDLLNAIQAFYWFGSVGGPNRTCWGMPPVARSGTDDPRGQRSRAPVLAAGAVSAVLCTRLVLLPVRATGSLDRGANNAGCEPPQPTLARSADILMVARTGAQPARDLRISP